ncbi:MAG: 23S rRNA (guanosine(2251)-2'-O)-methyltransferase RlmB [Pseudomonadota bacterium]
MSSRSRPRHSQPPNADSGDNSLLYGHHAVAAAWANPARRCRRLWATPRAWAHLTDQLSEPPAGRPPPTITDRDALDRLVGPGAVHQGLVLDAAPPPSPSLDALARQSSAHGRTIIVALDQVTDPHNVGAVLRSAAVFGALGLIVQDRHAPAITGALAKTASGAVDLVPIVRVTNLARALDSLKQEGFFAVGLAEQAEQALGSLDLPDRLVVTLGAEGEGLRRLTRERCDILVKLPSRGPMASLNVSNAAAVALYAVSGER